MNLLTTSTPGRKRQMVLIPEINPRSFLFFFEKGTSGYSYCLRDYSAPHQVNPRYARDFGWTADEVRHKATRVYDAPFLDVARLADWHSYTVELNRVHGLSKPTANAPLQYQSSVAETGSQQFPMLNTAA